MINEFVRLYFDFGSIDKALVEFKKIVSPDVCERFSKGLKGVRK